MPRKHNGQLERRYYTSNPHKNGEKKPGIRNKWRREFSLPLKENMAIIHLHAFIWHNTDSFASLDIRYTIVKCQFTVEVASLYKETVLSSCQLCSPLRSCYRIFRFSVNRVIVITSQRATGNWSVDQRQNPARFE